MLKISDFAIEYQKYILGIDEKKPRFSFVMQSDKSGVVLKNYHIKVFAGDITVWDSGKVFSDKSVHIEYTGEPLKPQTEYTVTLEVEDNHGETAQSSLKFETGLGGGENFQGDFISATLENEEVVPAFSKTVNITKQVKRARIYATALGVYEISINGKRVGNLYDAPFWTDYRYRLQYQTYNVTDLLKTGENELESLIANGWYKGTLGFLCTKNNYGDKTAFLMDLYIDYQDGTTQIFKTDNSWECKESQIKASDFFDGETIDTTFAGDKKYPVNILSYEKSKIISQINEPVRPIEEIKAQALIITPKKEIVVDFNQNLTGVVKFKFKGKRGDKIIINHAEVLDKEDNFYTENLRKAKAEDVFILNGKEQVLIPHFTFHGFRYIKLQGISADKIRLDDFSAVVLHSDMQKTGFFECSDKNVNQLQSNIVWSQRDNFFDIPSDCPQRDERLGWTGDADVFCRTATFNYNVAPFFAKWLGDLALAQTVENGVPDVIPDIFRIQKTASSCWGDAATIVPWTMYTVYGDERILKNQYQSMKDWIEYIRRNSTGNLWQKNFHYGDWLGLDREEGNTTGATDVYFIASAYYALSTDLVAKSAKVLGYFEDYEYYSNLYSEIVNAFRKEYITQTGRLVSETQTAYVLALYFNLIQDEFRERVASNLKKNLNNHNNHLVTGFVGTPYLCHALSENGLNDLAGILLLNNDYPSWLYEVKKGATTIWERWNGIAENGDLYEPSMNSYNHYAYGSVGDWMYRKLAGIDCLEPGYKKIRIKPYFVKGIPYVNAGFKSVYGNIAVQYKYEDGMVDFKIDIPVNTKAQIELPGRENETVGSGSYTYKVNCESNLLPSEYSLKIKIKEILDNAEAANILKNALGGPAYSQISHFALEMSFEDLISTNPELAKISDSILKIVQR